MNYYVIEKSGTADIVDIETTSNINQTGVWIFRVDQAEITEAPTEDPGMHTICPYLLVTAYFS